MKQAFPKIPAELQEVLGLDLKAIRKHMRSCPHEHYSNGECVLNGSDPFGALVTAHKSLPPPDVKGTAARLLPLLERLLEAIPQHCTRAQSAFTVSRLPDAIALSELYEDVAPSFFGAQRELEAAFAEKVTGQISSVYRTRIGRGGASPRLLAALDKITTLLAWSGDLQVIAKRKYRFQPRDCISMEQFNDASAALSILQSLAAELQPAAPQLQAPHGPEITDSFVLYLGKSPRVELNGARFDLTDETGRILECLASAEGRWVQAADLRHGASSEAAVKKALHRLPSPIRDLVEGKPGQQGGRRLTKTPRIVRS